MVEAKRKLLIVEDDLDLSDMLNAYFCVEGYEVITVSLGEEGVRAYQTLHPELVILDIRLPDIDGYEVARRLRTNQRAVDIPIIFMTEMCDRNDRLHGLELGVDDFITKPFDIQELRLRVRNVLRRATQDTLTNPVTGLPDGALVDEYLNGCLNRPNWTILIVSLNNLDAFRDIYGFVASDDVLRAVSVMLQNSIRENGDANDSLGQLGPADFILITLPERAASLQDRIRKRLEKSLDYFYPIKDRKKPILNSQKLVFKIGVLQSSDGPFTSLDILKLSILRKKK